VNYFDSPERYHDTNKQASAALFFSKIFRKKMIAATLTKTVTDAKISYADPTTIYKTVNPSGFVIDISETYENIFIYEPSTQKPSKTQAPFFESDKKYDMSDYYNGLKKSENSIWEPAETNAKPKKLEDIKRPIESEKFKKPEKSEKHEELEKPEELGESEESKNPEDPEDFFEPESKKTSPYLKSKKAQWLKKKTTIFASDLSGTLPTKVYKTTLDSEETELVNENSYTTFSFEQPGTNILEPDNIEKEPDSTSFETKRRYNTHLYSSTRAPTASAESRHIKHNGYETSLNEPELTEKGPKSIYSYYTTKFSADGEEKEATDGTIENQQENKNHGTSNPTITNAPESSDVTTHTKYYSSYIFYINNKSNLQKK
jgi:hypothetical protein